MASADTLFNSARGPLVRGELVEDNANTAVTLTEDPDAARDPGEPFLATNDRRLKKLCNWDVQVGADRDVDRVKCRASVTEGRGKEWLE